MLLMFLVDPLTTPRPWWMKKWVEFTAAVKMLAPTNAFDFFTYSELLYWFTFITLINPFRWKWFLFVFFGIGKTLPWKSGLAASFAAVSTISLPGMPR